MQATPRTIKTTASPQVLVSRNNYRIGLQVLNLTDQTMYLQYAEATTPSNPVSATNCFIAIAANGYYELPYNTAQRLGITNEIQCAFSGTWSTPPSVSEIV